MKYDLILITTHQDDIHIVDLIKSVNDNMKSNSVLLLIVSQECDIAFNSTTNFLDIRFIKETKMSLSKARNIALNHLKEYAVSAEYIMFPDDDTTFDESFFINFPTILNSNKCYIIPIYNVGTKELYLGKKTNDREIITAKNHQLIGSPNQILLYNDLKEDLFFNENLGIGAKYGSCEDFDLFLRLDQKGVLFVFENSLYNYHPKKVFAYKDISLSTIVRRFKNYSSGFAFVIFKYRLFFLIPEYLIRTLGAFIVFIFKFQLKLSVAYLIQFFIRIYLLIHFYLQKDLLKNE